MSIVSDDMMHGAIFVGRCDVFPRSRRGSCRFVGVVLSISHDAIPFAVGGHHLATARLILVTPQPDPCEPWRRLASGP